MENEFNVCFWSHWWEYIIYRRSIATILHLWAESFPVSLGKVGLMYLAFRIDPKYSGLIQNIQDWSKIFRIDPIYSGLIQYIQDWSKILRIDPTSSGKRRKVENSFFTQDRDTARVDNRETKLVLISTNCFFITIIQLNSYHAIFSLFCIFHKLQSTNIFWFSFISREMATTVAPNGYREISSKHGNID